MSCRTACIGGAAALQRPAIARVAGGPLVVTIHGILTSTTLRSWCDEFDKWSWVQNRAVKVVKREYWSWFIPAFNVWVRNHIQARVLAEEIYGFAQDGAGPISIIAHSNGADIALKCAHRLSALGVKLRSQLDAQGREPVRALQRDVRAIAVRDDRDRPRTVLGEAIDLLGQHPSLDVVPDPHVERRDEPRPVLALDHFDRPVLDPRPLVELVAPAPQRRGGQDPVDRHNQRAARHARDRGPLQGRCTADACRSAAHLDASGPGRSGAGSPPWPRSPGSGFV